MTSDSHIQLGSVRLSADGAAEMDGERPLLSIPRADIVRIESVYGTGAERPIVSLVLGIALIAVAILPIIALINVFRHGGRYHAEWIAGVACVIPGAWLIHLSLRRRWLLVVHQRRGKRKLLFPTDVDQVTVEAFVADARSRFGYA